MLLANHRHNQSKHAKYPKKKKEKTQNNKGEEIYHQFFTNQDEKIKSRLQSIRSKLQYTTPSQSQEWIEEI